MRTLRYRENRHAVKDEIISIIIQFKHDGQKDTTQLRVVNVSTAKEVLLSDSSFLLRFWIEDETVERCLIRHLLSGRQAYVQSGSGLQAFIKACLLNGEEEQPSSPEGQA